ncbi:MAG: Uma2 family endonuclease, partial [Microcystis sp. Msp_OC_L_20101000_S702]
PILGIRFEMFEEGLEVFYPNGERFKDPETLFEERNQAQQERNQAQQERDRAFARLRELGIDPTQL